MHSSRAVRSLRRSLRTKCSTRLEERRLLRRVADPDHGRVRRAELTAAGRRLLAKADAAVDSVEREMLAGLTGAERKALRDALGSAVRGLLDERSIRVPDTEEAV